MGISLRVRIAALPLAVAAGLAACSAEAPLTLATNVDVLESQWPELGDVESATYANRSTREWLPDPDDFLDAVVVLTPQAAIDVREAYTDFEPEALPGRVPEWAKEQLPSGVSWQVSEELNEDLRAESDVGQVTAWVAVGGDVVFIQHSEV